MIPLQHSTRTSHGLAEAYRAPAIAFPRQRRSHAQHLGIRFQRKVETYLRKLLTLTDYISFEVEPHYRFSLNGRTQSAFPDAVITFPTHRVIVEVKLKHTYDAWNQLTNLYLPILQRAHTCKDFRRLEIVRNYDPGVKLPEPSEVVTNLLPWLTATGEARYGIHIIGRT